MESPGPVVLLTVDTLRADRFTSTCFPKSFPTFERDFAQFTNALSHGNATPLAFPGMMTAHPVVGNGMFRSGARTIAEMFEHSNCTGFSNNAHLTEEKGYNRGFDSFHDLTPPDSQSFFEKLKQIDTLRNSEIATRAYRLFRSIRKARKGVRENGLTHPFPNPKTTADIVSNFVIRRLRQSDGFIWGHYMDPHKPFHPDQAVDGPEIDRSYEEIAYLNSYKHTKDPINGDDMEFLERLYESNIRYLDLELARLFEKMQEFGVYNDALIVVVGDHGELFGEHGLMFHPMDVDPVDKLIHTPLLIKYPDGKHAGERFSHLVQHADIMPSISEVKGLSVENIPDGVHPLTDTAPRSVLSKSNTSIRITESDGVAYKRRDGTKDGLDRISKTGRDILCEARFPAVETTDGTVAGVNEAERQQRLRALGYR